MLTIFIFRLLHAVRNQENADSKCSIEFDGQCVKRVSCTVEENAVIKKSELFVSYKNQGQKKEGIALCKWRLQEFYCDPSRGYTCELRLPTNEFFIFINTTARCVTSGEFIIDVAHQQPIQCNVSEYKTNQRVTTSEDELINTTDSIIVAVGVCVCVGLVISVIVAVGKVWRKRCRKHPERIVATQDSGENKDRENAAFLNQTESECEDSRKWSSLKRTENLSYLEKTPT